LVLCLTTAPSGAANQQLFSMPGAGSSNEPLSQPTSFVKLFTTCCAGVPYITRFVPSKLHVLCSAAHGIHTPPSIDTALADDAAALSSDAALSQPVIDKRAAKITAKRRMRAVEKGVREDRFIVDKIGQVDMNEPRKWTAQGVHAADLKRFRQRATVARGERSPCGVHRDSTVRMRTRGSASSDQYGRPAAAASADVECAASSGRVCVIRSETTDARCNARKRPVAAENLTGLFLAYSHIFSSYVWREVTQQRRTNAIKVVMALRLSTLC
jgi:hypothetical protein